MNDSVREPTLTFVKVKEPTLVLVRGLPGSGKSTLAATKYPKYSLVEADQYFIDKKTGEYRYDLSKRHTAHRWCKNKVKSQLEKLIPTIVANTFTETWELKPYFDMARDLGMEVELIEAKGDYGSIHNVPEEAIQRMKDRWESTENVLHTLNAIYA